MADNTKDSSDSNTQTKPVTSQQHTVETFHETYEEVKIDNDELARKNSKIIVIKRTNNHVPAYEEGNQMFDLYLENTQCGFSCRAESSTKPNLYTGLTKEEENILLPLLTDIGPISIDSYHIFNAKKREFYSALRAFVNYRSGLSLEIGLTKDNTLPISKDNLPLNPHKFATYRALFHNDPTVAKNKEEGKSNIQYRAYIEDADYIKDKRDDLQEAKDDAFTIYVQIKNSIRELRKFIAIIEEKSLDEKLNDSMELKARLMKHLDTNPKKFIDAYYNKDNETMLELVTFMSYGVLEIKIGGSIHDKETGEKIGDNKKEAIAWLKADRNASVKANFTKKVMDRKLLKK